MQTMIKRLVAAAALTLALGVSAEAQDKIQPAAQQAALESGKVRVIIVTRANTAFRDGGNALRRPAGYVSRKLGLKAQNVEPIGQLPMASATVSPEALEALRDDPNIAFVVKDELRRASLVDTVASTGAAKHEQAGFGGKGWTVAILDSGIDRNHPAFAKAMRSEACFSSDYSGEEGESKSLCKNGKPQLFGKGAAAPCDLNFSEQCFHGTHVAGIIAGRPFELPDGRVVGGMAPEAGLIVAQVFSGFTDPKFCGEGQKTCISAWDSDIIKALEWVYSKRQKFKIAAINMSLGSGDFKEACDSQSPYAEIIQRLRDANIATVVAAGNEAIADGIGIPACISSTVSVSATLKTGKIDESYSNVARFVSLAAPGTDILSTVPGGGYGSASGTSMAAPHVAGAFAILRGEKPGLSVTDMVKLLRKTGRTIKDSRTGTKLKRIDLARIEPGGSEPVGMVQQTPADAEDAGFELQSQLITYGSSDMRTVIVQSDMSAEEIKAKLGEGCKESEGCGVTRIGEKTYKVTVPFALVEALGAGKGVRALEKEMESVLGGGAKVFRNRLNKPMGMKVVK